MPPTYSSMIFFVVVTLTSDANSQTPHWFRVTHVPESGSRAEDRDFDTRLLMEAAADVSSRIVLAASPISDEDDDRLYDIVETDTGVFVSTMNTGSDPFAWDTDGDGFYDGREVALGSDPNDPLDTSPPRVPALGPWGQALLLLALAGSAGRALMPGSRRSQRYEAGAG